MADDSTQSTGGENLGAIFQILQNADKVAQAQSPYAPVLQGAQALAQATDPLARNPYTGHYISSPAMAAVSGLTNGLLRGFGQTLQNSYVGDQDKAASGLLNQAFQSEDPSKLSIPEGMNPSVFSSMINGVSIFKQAKDLQDYQNSLAVKKQIGENLAKQIVPNELGVLPPGASQAIKGLDQLGYLPAGIKASESSDNSSGDSGNMVPANIASTFHPSIVTRMNNGTIRSLDDATKEDAALTNQEQSLTKTLASSKQGEQNALVTPATGQLIGTLTSIAKNNYQVSPVQQGAILASVGRIMSYGSPRSASGAFSDPTDTITNVLTSKFGYSAGLAKHYLTGEASMPLDALTAVGSLGIQQAANIAKEYQNYIDGSKTAGAAQGLNPNNIKPPEPAPQLDPLLDHPFVKHALSLSDPRQAAPLLSSIGIPKNTARDLLLQTYPSLANTNQNPIASPPLQTQGGSAYNGSFG